MPLARHPAAVREKSYGTMMLRAGVNTGGLAVYPPPTTWVGTSFFFFFFFFFLAADAIRSLPSLPFLFLLSFFTRTVGHPDAVAVAGSTGARPGDAVVPLTV